MPDNRPDMREEVAARDALPDERHAAEGDIRRARGSLDGYGVAHERELSEFGPAALGNARYGFVGGDWLTALLLFEALDTDYAYTGDSPGSAGDEWGGGDFGGRDF